MEFRVCVLRSPNCHGKDTTELRRNASRTTTTVHYDWSQLNNRDIRDKYTLTLKKQIRSTTGDIKNTHSE